MRPDSPNPRTPLADRRRDDNKDAEDTHAGTDDVLPAHIIQAKEEPELEEPAAEDEELPPELARLQPKETPEPSGTVYPSPTTILLNTESE